MAGMGPPPKPDGQRARRNATVATSKLPAEGRQGETPKWPLIDDVQLTAKRDIARATHRAAVARLDDEALTKRQRTAAEKEAAKYAEVVAVLNATLRAQRKLEATLWAELWHSPQAFMWGKDWVRDVAQYVRHKVLAELGSLDDAKEARQWSDRLGLNPQAMLRLRWEIAPATPELTAVGGTARPRSTTSRARYGALRAAGTGAVAAD